MHIIVMHSASYPENSNNNSRIYGIRIDMAGKQIIWSTEVQESGPLHGKNRSYHVHFGISDANGAQNQISVLGSSSNPAELMVCFISVLLD